MKKFIPMKSIRKHTPVLYLYFKEIRGGGYTTRKMRRYQGHFSRTRILPIKWIATSFLTLLLGSLIFCQDYRNPPKLQLSIQPSLGYKGGSIGEHLFNMDGYGQSVPFAPAGGKQISFLKWDIYGMLVTGLDLEFQYKSFFSQIYGRVGISMPCGKMDDFDWNSTRGHQTHFSTHDNRLQDHIVAGGFLGWTFSSPDRRIQFVPMAGFSWQQTSMIARDGYKQYVPGHLQETTPWTDDLEKGYFSGDVISYRHEVFQVDLLFRITYNHSPRLYFQLDTSIHPIIGAFGYDTHILRNLQFLDYNMNGQLSLGAALTIGYQVLPQHFLTLKVDYNYLPVVVGPTYMKGTRQPYYYPESSSRGGASHWFAGVTLGWKFNLFQ